MSRQGISLPAQNASIPSVSGDSERSARHQGLLAAVAGLVGLDGVRTGLAREVAERDAAVGVDAGGEEVLRARRVDSDVDRLALRVATARGHERIAGRDR